jgi:hypothetical protein
MEHVEQVHTNERVPGHPNYYEKDGLRTQGDGIDHEAEPKMTFARMMSLIAMAFCKQYVRVCSFKASADETVQCGQDLKFRSISSVVSILIVISQHASFTEEQ